MLCDSHGETTIPSAERWPTRVPGQPARWVLDVRTKEPADHCPVHDEALEVDTCTSCLASDEPMEKVYLWGADE